MDCSIIVDSREHACIESFKNQNISYTIETLDIGDFWIVDKEKKPLIIIERKRIDDFSSSLSSGRLHEQKYRLLHNKETAGAKIAYILEGNLVYENQKIKNKSAKPVYSAIWSITFGKNIDLFQTRNAFHTCMCIDSICRKIRKRGQFWDAVSTNESYGKILSSKKKNNDNPKQCATEMICCIRGVSHSIATLLLDEFKNVPLLCTSIQEGTFKERSKNLQTTTKNGKKRRIPKTVIARIEEYLTSSTNENTDPQDDPQDDPQNETINE